MSTRRVRRHPFRVPTVVGALASLLVAGLVFVPAGAQATVTATSTTLPGTLGAMVVDAATSHVFVSLTDTSKIAVLDFTGKIVKTISGESGASGLALVGSDLYVVDSTAGAIDDINTGTLTLTRTLTTGISGMKDIAFGAGSLWVTSGSNLISVALSDGTQTSFTNPFVFGRGLVADPADTNMLFEYDAGDSPVTIASLDLTVSPPAIIASQSQNAPRVISNVNNIAVSPDGSHVVPAGGAPYEFDEIATNTLSQSGVVYPANPYPQAVAMTSANGGLFAGGMNGIYWADVVVYRLDNPSQKIATYDFGTTSTTVVPGGLAFNPNGLKLFAVTNDKKFHVLTGTGSGSGLGSAPKPPALTLSPASLKFGNQRVATYGHSKIVTIANNTAAPVVLQRLTFAGADHFSFFGFTNCFPHGRPRTLAPGVSCRAAIRFAPIKYGARHATLRAYDDAAGSPQSMKLGGSGTDGYFLAGAQGEVGRFGDAVFHGDATHLSLKAPMISLATTPNGAGYWLLGLDGGIFTFGNAKFHGSTGAMHLNKPIVAMYPTPNGKGYWLVASDGGIFTFGNARFHGSTAGRTLSAPIVGMASTPDGRGYWLVGGDGSVFAFGNAKFHGSTTGKPLSAPVVQVVTTPTGHGYWLLTGDGHLFAYGDAHNFGSAAGQAIAGMAPTSDGRGYWEVSRTGAVHSYGDAHAHGSLHAGIADVIGIAATAPPLPPILVPFATARASSGVSGPTQVIDGSGGREGSAHRSG